MKKITFSLLSICVILYSCKKDHKIAPSVSALQKVTFTVGFSQSTGGIAINSVNNKSLKTNSAPDTALTNHIDGLYYMIFDSVGNLVQNISQSKTDTAFGHYTENLHIGKYTIAIAGGSGMTINPGTLNKQTIYGGFAFDTFFERLQITVGITPVNQAFSLHRLTSKLIININDAIPANATYAKVGLYGVGNSYAVGTDVISTTTITSYLYSNIPGAAVGTTNYQISGIFLYAAPFSADIAVADNSNLTTVYGEKVVSNITGAPNKITKLSGNLFGGTGGGQVGADTTWKAPILQTFP